MHLLQTSVDGETWETVDRSEDVDKLIAKKREMDHCGVDNLVDLRIINEDDEETCWECKLPLSQCGCDDQGTPQDAMTDFIHHGNPPPGAVIIPEEECDD